MVSTSPVYVTKYNAGDFTQQPDLLAVEEPLEIRIGFGKETDRQQESLSVTMRTPGNDEELAVGFLFSEGIITNFNQILSVKHCCELGEQQQNNVIRVELKQSVVFDFEKLNRHFYTTSSCGVCGKSSIEAVEQNISPIKCVDNGVISIEKILQFSNKLREKQLVFKHTGSIHAAGLFSFSGDFIKLKEDVGRHNAVDKLIGSCLINNEPLQNVVLLLSGRISFELVQKASTAQIPIIVAIGAPSSLAVRLATEMNITLIGFIKEKGFNVYSHKQRIAS